MVALPSHLLIAQAAANEYSQHAAEIERVRNSTELYRQGRLSLAKISPSPQRVEARMRREMLHESHLAGSAAEILLRANERMIGNQLDLQEACLLEKLVKFSRAVGRVVLPPGQGTGTGWLIGHNLLLTNHHVLPNRQVARATSVMMGYERNAEGVPQNGHTYRLRPDLFFLTPRETASPDEEVELDFTLVGVETISMEGKQLADFPFITLDAAPGKVIEAENCLVVQHPKGDYKKITLRDNRLLLVVDQPGADNHLFYESDTLPGSSGGLVVGLGTGEAIALHRSGVPRRDNNQNILKKNQQIWTPADADEDVDWIANQGVRVSRIVEGVSRYAVDAGMEARRQQLVEAMAQKAGGAPIEVPVPEKALASASVLPLAGGGAGHAGAGGVSEKFLVRVNPDPLARAHVRELVEEQFPGSKVEELVGTEALSRMATYLVVEVPNVGDPWAVAGELERVDGVEEAEPDLPRYTAVGPEELRLERAVSLPRFLESTDNKGDERSFLNKWLQVSPYLNTLNPQAPGFLRQIREWNHRVVNYDSAAIAALLGAAGLQVLTTLRIAQFDTGYTDHSKVRGGYDLANDYDALDKDDNAQDELSGFNPHHGTRTASLLIGVKESSIKAANEGNYGLLFGLNSGGVDAQVRVTPFRIAQKVVLIGNVRSLVRATERALAGHYAVMTMSMGTVSLFGSTLKDLVRDVYDRGVIWCCAAGNEVGFVVAPAKYPGAIAVAASNPVDEPWEGSSHGSAVDITAPGEDVYVPVVTDGQEGMRYGNGTSYATPHVAAAAALWLARHQPALSQYPQAWQRVEAFRYCLQLSARPGDKLPRGEYGAGFLDIQRLLGIALPPADQLRHAYSGGLGLERASIKHPLAARELEYKDWQTVMNAALTGGAETSRTGMLLERNADALGILSAEARRFARLLEGHGQPRSASRVLETDAPLPGRDAVAAYQRLAALDAMQMQAKPDYARTALAPAYDLDNPQSAGSVARTAGQASTKTRGRKGPKKSSAKKTG